jgi:hypothetical protein
MLRMILLSVIVFATSNLAQIEIDSSNIYTFYYNGIKYEVIKENRNWHDAVLVAENRGGILAEINSQEEQDSIYFHIQNAGITLENTVAPDGGEKSYLFLGGNDINEEGKWIWDGNFDNYGKQFWQGTFSEGYVVDSLYNNWGNEPDNFSGQDALGLALENWARGSAGEWNDISIINELYFLIEYDFSTIQILNFNYNYENNEIVIYPILQFDYDSVRISINDSINFFIQNVQVSDSILIIPFNTNISEMLRIRLFAYRLNQIAVSKELILEVLSKKEGFNSYITDFEELPFEDFVGIGFNIEKPFPFRNNSIHTEHDYNNNSNLTYTLIKPIIVSESNPIVKFSEVVIVEPGEEGSSYREENFNDYVVVEGSKTLGEWVNLTEGYDSRYYPEWLDAWHNGALLRNLYKSREINLADTFNPQDTILIRFRLFSDGEVNGWGWTIDSLQIQNVLSDANTTKLEYDYSLSQNFPNPFNPNTQINFSIPKAENVSIGVYNAQGEFIFKLLNKKLSPGTYTFNFNGENLASGIYFYQIKTGTFSKTRKMILLK